MTKQQFIVKQKIKLFDIKFSLERKWLTELNSYFNECKAFVKSGQRTCNSIHSVLVKQHRNIINKLLPNKKKAVDKFKIWNIVDMANADYIKKNSHQIDDTTMNLINESFRQAGEEMKSQGVMNPSGQMLNLVAAKIFNNYKMGRIKNIAITNTNGLVENVRKSIITSTGPMVQQAIHDWNTEDMNELSDITDSWRDYEIDEEMQNEEEPEDEYKHRLMASVTLDVKVWGTMGDDKVRPAHEDADGQEQPLDQPFIVDGEMLMYPGDTDLGASAGNVCNCRCSSVY
jgi:hypothetical protein